MDIANKRILVTGADGFIGSHLVERLISLKCKVRALVYYNSFNSWGWLDTFDKKALDRIEVFPGDVRDSYGVRKAIEGIDIVFHLAALIAIPYSYYSPESYVETNIRGTLNILQAAREEKCKRIIITSTSEVYGTAQYVPIDEKHPFQGQSPYSATKIAADRLAESFYRSFDMPICIARPFNTFGPRQSARAIIPTIITQLLSGEKKIKLGNIHPTRDFLFVRDTVDGFVSIATSERTIGEEINIATQREISIGDLAGKIISMVNPSATIAPESLRMRPKKSEVGKLLGCNEKIKKLTTWRPHYTLEEGLKETITWFNNKENFKRYKHDKYNV